MWTKTGLVGLTLLPMVSVGFWTILKIPITIRVRQASCKMFLASCNSNLIISVIDKVQTLQTGNNSPPSEIYCLLTEAIETLVDFNKQFDNLPYFPII